MTIRTPNLPTSNLIDELIGNMDGNTVRIAIARLAAIMLSYQGPPYATRAQLFADLDWPSGAIATVWNDTAALNGVYRKSGSAGTGSWSRIGDLPTAPLTASQLAAKADASALAEEITARINATRDAGVLPLVVDTTKSTANALVADIAPALDGVTLSALSTGEIIPAADNTDPVTLNVGGAGAWPVHRRNGSALEPGDLKAGMSALVRRRGNSWRLINTANSEIDAKVAAEAVLRTEADAALRSNGGKIFTSRADAVAFGQAALHPALGSIITVEGNALVMRAPYGKTDPLFGTDPTWGVAMPPIDVTALQQAVAAERGARSSLIEAAPGGGGLVIVDEAGFVGLRVSRSGRLSVFGQPINQN